MARTPVDRRIRRRRLTVLGAVLLVVALSALLLLNRESLSRRLVSGGTTEQSGAALQEPWLLDDGSSRSFAVCGNSLAVVSSTGLQVLGPGGLTETREVFAMDAPAVAATDRLIAAFNVGGTQLRLADTAGNVYNMDTEQTIISVSLSEKGYMAASTEEAGYRGMVTVYDEDRQAVFKWHSGEGYLLGAQVSPNGKLLAALTASEDGGAVHIFLLTSETEQARYDVPGGLITDVRWLGDGVLCALTETSAVFMDAGCREISAYDFGGLRPAAYDFGGDGFLTLALSEYSSGTASLLVTVDASGRELGRLEPGSRLIDLTARGRSVLALFEDEAVLYTRALVRRGSSAEVQGVAALRLRQRGDALFIRTYSIIPLSF